MDERLLAGRYQILKHMQHVSEADYYAGLDAIAQHPITIRTIDVSQSGAVGIGLDHLAAEKLRRKMENEKRLIARLDHPGLLKILDHGFDDPLYFHIYPPFAFDSLQIRLDQQGRIPWYDALDTMEQLAETLTYLHGIGIVHCDVSPQTVLFADGQVKLAEFTIANHEQIADSTTGDPPYMSPESFAGAKPAPARDIWAFGVTIYYTITGELPFGALRPPRAMNVPEIIQRIMGESPKPATTYTPDLPIGLLALFDRLLEKDPELRIGSMRAVADEIRIIRLQG